MAVTITPDVCIVVPAHNEEQNVEALHREVSEVLDPLGVTYTLLFVDDGSTDATGAILRRLHEQHPNVLYVKLARNFGLQAALTAGLEFARGRAIVVMDADLQDDPQALVAFLERWRAGAEIVYAVRTRRQEGVLKRAISKAFYWGLTRLADIPIPRDAGSFALYDQRVVREINDLPERCRYLPGLRAWVGFRQVAVPVARRARRAGAPKQSLVRLVRLALDGLFAFSKAPLRFATFLGLLVTGVAVAGLCTVAYWRFVQRSFPSGVGLATIALSLLFLGGVQLLMTGIIGEYIGRVYDEVKRRPHFIVADAELTSSRSPASVPAPASRLNGIADIAALAWPDAPVKS